MIVIVSNRNVNNHANDHTVFGDEANAKGLQELRVAVAEFDEPGNLWRVKLLREKRRDLDAGNPPSRQLFKRILRKTKKGSLTPHWVMYVHGYGPVVPRQPHQVSGDPARLRGERACFFMAFQPRRLAPCRIQEGACRSPRIDECIRPHDGESPALSRRPTLRCDLPSATKPYGLQHGKLRAGKLRSGTGVLG